jgi:tetratricopeptide (TPR) repeat protein
MERAAKLCVPATPALQRAYLGLLATIRAALERDHAGVRTELSGLVDVATRHRMLPWFEGFIDVLSILEAVDGGQPSEQEIARGLGGIRQLEASGQRLFLPYFTAQLALGLAHQRRHREARLMWERAWAHCAETSQGWCAAELWRVRAELWLRAEAPDPQQAIGCFEQALALGREQGARLWELRAALGLASLLRQQARPDDAVNVLAPVYESWPEDVDTADRVATRGLLRELGYVKSSPAAGA